MTPPVPKPREGGAPGAAMPPRAAVGFLIAVAVILGVAVANWTTLESRRSSATGYTRTLETLRDLALVRTAVVDAETGQRGYLLSGQEDYLAPFHAAGGEVSGRVAALRGAFEGDPRQRALLDRLKANIDEKFAEMDRTIELRRAGNAADAIAIIMTDRGRAAMERIRTILSEMETRERDQAEVRQREWNRAAYVTVAVSMGGFVLLLILTAAAASMTARDHRAREMEAWLRGSHAQFVQRIQGEYRLEQLGSHVLEFLAAALDARVGAAYVASGGDHFRRIATWAMEADASGEIVLAGEGLLGQAAKESRAMIVRDVPDGYLPVASSLGKSASREVLVAPASADGIVQAVVELGFFRTLDAADADLLNRVSSSLATAVRASRDRSRLEELLEETQRQAEELQTQQEELRVTNEELEEQGRALKESQVQMQNQQAELEQTNTQLEEQTQLLEAQRDEVGRAQLELVAKAADLERANQYKSEFLANMSHELRTPLNSSLILAKLLADNKDGNLTEEQVRYAQTISSAGNDLLTLINDILDLSRIEAGRMEIVSESVLVAQMIDALMRTFEPVARQRKLDMTASIDAAVPARIETDGQRLSQILRNLVSNALKFTPHGAVSLRVFAAPDGDIAFAVRDTGIGIPAEQHETIFEAFRQAEGGTHRKYGGSGLGLSISRDLARLLGGDLSVESQPGEGSTFTLRVPGVYRGPASVLLSSAAATVAPAPPP
ncbi:MAG TPA: CHASE3 domain-containing protein, partial [Nevskiaceae bacterium]|nr:CHASE3 domain-containing protein [Nevskiaceae bacterium]